MVTNHLLTGMILQERDMPSIFNLTPKFQLVGGLKWAAIHGLPFEESWKKQLLVI